jgi:hypothetical protein
LNYKRLVDVVLHQGGAEALRVACAVDDKYACRLAGGEQRRTIMEDAGEFFASLMGVDDTCPTHFKEEDWLQLRIIRNQWIPEPGQSVPGADEAGGDGRGMQATEEGARRETPMTKPR